MDILETVLPSDRAENFPKTSRTFSFKPHYEIVNNLSSLEQKIQEVLEEYEIYLKISN